MPPHAAIYARRLGDKKYFVGGRLSWADLMVAEFVDRIKMICGDEVLAEWPSLLAHAKMVHSLPALAEYASKRQASPY